MWFIAYRHSLRPDEAGIRFVQSKDATFIHARDLEAAGYIITNVAPTSKGRMEAFLAGSLSDPEQPLLG